MRSKRSAADLLCLRLCSIVVCSRLETSRERFSAALRQAGLTAEEFISQIVSCASPICQSSSMNYHQVQVLFWCGWLLSFACNYLQGNAFPSQYHTLQWQQVSRCSTENTLRVKDVADIALSSVQIRRWTSVVGSSCNLSDFLNE